MKMIKTSFAFLLAILLITNGLLAQNTGTINGYVRDARTLLPLTGASVKLQNSDLGAITDEKGYYRIAGIPTRTFNLEATATGYRSEQRFDVSVTSGNAIELSFELEPAYKELSGVVVKPGFVKPVGVVNSVQSLGTNEIAKYPGANFDIAKVVQSLPGVSGSVGFRNDIIIRGGAPNENTYFLDGIEIPSINHFATQGAAGGPVGLLNVSFIEGVTLHTSAFPAKYDNPLSGVLQFKQKTGNPEGFQGNFRLSASEAALTAEGPLGRKNGKTTYLASVRRSYLQFIFQLIELPFLPDYWDYQYKVTHKLDNKNELNFIGIGAIDNFTFKRPDNPTLEQLAILEQFPLNTQRTNTAGFSWRHTMQKGFWTLALSNNRLVNTADQYEDNEKPVDSERILAYKSTEDETRLRYELNFSTNGWQFSTGVVGVYARYDNSTFQRRPGYVANYFTEINFLRYGAFFNATRRFFSNRLTLSGGVRADGNTFTTNGNDLSRTLSPRLSASYRLSSRLNLNTSAGRYYKIAPYTILGYRENDVLVNRNVDYIQSDHLVSGIEYTPSSSTRITLEGFYKWYDQYPVSIDKGISLANLGGNFGVLGNERVNSNGRGKAYGFEFMYQERLTRNFYGILAYTFYYSLFTGSDRNRFIASAWDNRHLVSFTGGYKFPRNWEVGLRFRYQGEAPATPYQLFESLENYPFTNAPVFDYSRVNSDRLPAFNAADLRIDKKWNFRKWSLDLFLDVQNLYNSNNPTQPGFTLKRNPDNTIATSTGEPYNPGVFGNPQAPNNRQLAVPAILPNTSGSRLPSMGFVVEF
ncbi:MAG TPA: TonB-dependent receptor [Lacibacter sp.]|nr:TonB-dependent receptor [Lacibacter sp.]HMO89126.1 TonB-dependent receptor [Lacibacter sp.]